MVTTFMFEFECGLAGLRGRIEGSYIERYKVVLCMVVGVPTGVIVGAGEGYGVVVVEG